MLIINTEYLLILYSLFRYNYDCQTNNQNLKILVEHGINKIKFDLILSNLINS